MAAKFTTHPLPKKSEPGKNRTVLCKAKPSISQLGGSWFVRRDEEFLDDMGKPQIGSKLQVLDEAGVQELLMRNNEIDLLEEYFPGLLEEA